MKTLAGQLLVASPHLRHHFFARTVVLLLDHNETGAVGVVLNRPMAETMQTVWPQISRQPCVIAEHVNFGGPVPGPLVALHANQSLAESALPSGVCVAAEINHLEDLVRRPAQPFRLFVGHAGWKKGQLEREIRKGNWLVTPAKLEHVFGDEESLWIDAVRQIGRDFLKSVLGVKNIPANPNMN